MDEEKLSRLIDDIKSNNFVEGVFEPSKAFGEMEKVVHDIMHYRLHKMLDDNFKTPQKGQLTVPKADIELFDTMIDLWKVPLRYVVITHTKYEEKPSERNDELVIKQKKGYSVNMSSTAESIMSEIDVFMGKIRKYLEAHFMTKDDKAFIGDLHTYVYKNLVPEDQKLLERVMTRNFDIKYVECVGEYSSVDYFETDEGNNSEPETQCKAVMSNRDSTFCLSKGVYLKPRTESNDNDLL